MINFPNRYDMIFVSDYALKMINAMPENTKHIKMSGGILYAYFANHSEIINNETPLLSYEVYIDFCKNISSSINLTDNELSSDMRKIKYDCLEFNQFFENFWLANQRINLSGAITINLSKFSELEYFSICNVYCYNIINIPETVKDLHCRSCSLSKLSKMPKSLETLNCSGNRLRLIPQLIYTSLKYLFCNSNLLKKIPVLPNSVEWVYCYDNLINELPDPLPISLRILSCFKNNLTYLPNIPPNMVGLYIDNNEIRKIPPLPKPLIDFFFSNNRVSKMPDLPPFLQRITCNMNPIREFTPFPPSVKYANIEGTIMELW